MDNERLHFATSVVFMPTVMVSESTISARDVKAYLPNVHKWSARCSLLTTLTSLYVNVLRFGRKAMFAILRNEPSSEKTQAKHSPIGAIDKLPTSVIRTYRLQHEHQIPAY